MNPVTAVQREPIAAATLAVIVSWLIARYLLDFDSDASSAIALVVLAVGQFVARSLTVTTPPDSSDSGVT